LHAGEEEIVGKIYESQALGAFKKGLKIEVQQAICAATPETLEDALVVGAEISAVEEGKKSL
jgi:hypothetical protein